MTWLTRELFVSRPITNQYFIIFSVGRMEIIVLNLFAHKHVVVSMQVLRSLLFYFLFVSVTSSERPLLFPVPYRTFIFLTHREDMLWWCVVEFDLTIKKKNVVLFCRSSSAKSVVSVVHPIGLLKEVLTAVCRNNNPPSVLNVNTSPSSISIIHQNSLYRIVDTTPPQ